jgi:hypothetical protein
VSLTFVVGTGRCGSTGVSRVLRKHPDVLSVSELLVALRRTLSTEFPEIDGPELWQLLTDPPPLWDAVVRSGIPMAELCYPSDRGRFNPLTGLPHICTSMLPMLSDDPDALFDQLGAEIPAWGSRGAADHYRSLFAVLGRIFGTSAVVERSGGSVGIVPALRQQFPEARFVHMHRDGPDCAVSMSRHPVFRQQAIALEMGQALGFTLADTMEVLISGAEIDDAVIPERYHGLLTAPVDPQRLMSYPLPLTLCGALWSSLVCAGVPALAELPPDSWTTLRYEELLADPAAELTRLADFIGVPATARWLAAATALIQPRRPISLAAELEPDEQAALRDACAAGAEAIAAAESLLTPQ